MRFLDAQSLGISLNQDDAILDTAQYIIGICKLGIEVIVEVVSINITYYLSLVRLFKIRTSNNETGDGNANSKQSRWMGILA